MPYWLRGGVIGALIALVFVGLLYSCLLITYNQESTSFGCVIFLHFSPMNPFASLYDYLDFSLGIRTPFVMVPISSVIVLSLIGALIGTIISFIKKRTR